MANWRLTAKQNVTSPNNGFINGPTKDLRKGFSFIVAAQSTGGPSHQDVVGALLLEGFSKEEAEYYDNSAWSYYFDGVEIGETDFNRANQQFKAQLNRNNYSAHKSTSEMPIEQKKDYRSPGKVSKINKSINEDDSEEEITDDDDSLFEKILFFPFKVIWWIIKGLWWIIKLVFSIVTFGYFSSLFVGDD